MPDQPIPVAVVYKDIPGFPGYRAGSDGSIWSCHRHGPGPPAPWKKKKQSRRSRQRERLLVTLYLGRKRKTVSVHRLVLEAFAGPCPEGMECCHKDGNAANNALGNLRWDTRGGNEADKAAHGTGARFPGEENPGAKLSEKSVREIRVLLAQGTISQRDIAQKFGVGQGEISRIKTGENWGCLE